jgi:hypothetical protein
VLKCPSNHEDKDPALEVGAWAFTAGQVAHAGSVARLAYRYQAYLFFPLLLLEAISLHVASVQALLRRCTRDRAWEAVLLAAHLAGYLTVVLVLSPVKALVFILVHQGLFGCTWVARSRPTTRAWRCWTLTRRTSCAAKC